MPQKRNPISSVYITAQTAMVKQLVAALLEAMVEDHERATGPWEIEWIALPEIFMLSAGALAQTRFVVEGLQVNEKKMRENLDITNGLIMSEAVMMGLGAAMGRNNAHDVVYDICREVVKTGRPLIDLLAEDKEISKHADRKTLEKMADPANYLGVAGEMVDRVLKMREEVVCRPGRAKRERDPYAAAYRKYTEYGSPPSRGRRLSVFGIVCQIASATSSVAAPRPRNSTGTVTPAFCNSATSTVAAGHEGGVEHVDRGDGARAVVGAAPGLHRGEGRHDEQPAADRQPGKIDRRRGCRARRKTPPPAPASPPAPTRRRRNAEIEREQPEQHARPQASC